MSVSAFGDDKLNARETMSLRHWRLLVLREGLGKSHGWT